jgi:hypothetical protein
VCVVCCCDVVSATFLSACNLVVFGCVAVLSSAVNERPDRPFGPSQGPVRTGPKRVVEQKNIFGGFEVRDKVPLSVQKSKSYQDVASSPQSRISFF